VTAPLRHDRDQPPVVLPGLPNRDRLHALVEIIPTPATVSGILLLYPAGGLRRRKRRAWRAAVVVTVLARDHDHALMPAVIGCFNVKFRPRWGPRFVLFPSSRDLAPASPWPPSRPSRSWSAQDRQSGSSPSLTASATTPRRSVPSVPDCAPSPTSGPPLTDHAVLCPPSRRPSNVGPWPPARPGEASPSPVYGAALLMRFGLTAHPGFESRSLRP
jgi:hypothetical protein